MHRKIIFSTLLLWLGVCIAGALRFGHPFAGAVLVFAPFAMLFPGVTGVLAWFIPAAVVVALCALAVFAWRRRSTALTAMFCCVLLSSSSYGWFVFEQFTRHGIL